MSAAPLGYASAAMSSAPGLDLADFPALGSQVPQHSSASSANASSMFSSYASQAGTGVSNSAMMMSRSGASFTPEEFPTLHRAHANVTYGSEHQQQQQPRHTLAQDLRKQDMHVPSQGSPSAATAAVAGGGPSPSTQSPGMWMQQPSYGSPHQNALSRIGLARIPHDNATAAAATAAHGEAPHGVDLNAFKSNHDAMQRSAASASAYGPSGESLHLPIQQVLTSPVDRFGLVGLVSLIKTQSPDVAMLTMGCNLQALGMNLDLADALSTSFVTPWAQDQAAASTQVEPAFQLPGCYNVQPPPAQAKAASFSDETLFFIFYSTPRDALQEMAASELYARNWRYHKGLHLWLTKDPNTEPLQKTSTYERGTYVFFDPGSWEKISKNFVLMYEMLEDKPAASQGMMTAATSSVPAGAPPNSSAAAAAAAHAAAHATTASGKPLGSQRVAPARGSSMPSSNQASSQSSYS